MSKGYEEAMLTLTMSGAVMKILTRTFTNGDFEDELLKYKCNNLYNMIKELTKEWPHQDSEKAIQHIAKKTNEKIRGNKYLQGTGVYAISLMSIVSGRLTDLYGHVKNLKRKNNLDKILDLVKDLNDIFEQNMTDEKMRESQYEIGDSIYNALDEEMVV